MKTQEIADFLSAKLVGDGDIEITSVADIDTATAGQLAFLEKGKGIGPTHASCVIVPDEFESGDLSSTLIFAHNPKLAFARAAAKLYSAEPPRSWHATSDIAAKSDVRASLVGAFTVVGEGASIGEGSEIHDGVKVGKKVTIGTSTVIHPNCVLYDGISIGDNCVIHAGSVIGAAGFGYVRDEDGEYHLFPQIGTVVIEDNVEIGANSCIDRGALGETRIGKGTKIDNLVQIAHNVKIGKRVVIAAQTGISGSTVIEDDCIIGGQVGMGDHALVKSGAVIGSQAGVLPGKIVRPGVWWGTPVQPLDEYKRQNAHVKGLERLKNEVKELKKLSGK
ncbi:MAG: UDP-3-O-(3-hydroxymyristoyl)glucosamine N-acyltransferase [Pyrinomonadaceae bacterium]